MLTGDETVLAQGVCPDGTPSHAVLTVQVREISALAGSVRGTVKVSGATPVSVDHPDITAANVFALSLATAEGSVGPRPVITALTPGVGFEVTAFEGDASTYNWVAL